MMARGEVAHQGLHVLVEASGLGLLQAPALCGPPVLLIHIICSQPRPHQPRPILHPPLQTGNAGQHAQALVHVGAAHAVLTSGMGHMSIRLRAAEKADLPGGRQAAGCA